MRFSTSALAIALTATAAPAAAQYGYNSQQTLPTAGAQSAPKQPVNAPNGPKASPKAIKALIALQTAVNARDMAKIPGAIAAAQAVVSTKEDKYLLGQIELNAAVFAKDYAGMASAVDLMASSNYLDAKTMASTYRALGSTLYNVKQLEKASAAFERSLTLEPNNPTALVELGETLRGSLEYNRDLFEAESITRLISHFERLLESIASDPQQRVSELEMFDESEQYTMLVKWNETRAEYEREQCVHQLFEAQVERTPAAVAWHGPPANPRGWARASHSRSQ